MSKDNIADKAYMARLLQGDLPFSETFFGWTVLLHPLICKVIITLSFVIGESDIIPFMDSDILYPTIFFATYCASMVSSLYLIKGSGRCVEKLQGLERKIAYVLTRIGCYLIPMGIFFMPTSIYYSVYFDS